MQHEITVVTGISDDAIESTAGLIALDYESATIVSYDFTETGVSRLCAPVLDLPARNDIPISEHCHHCTLAEDVVATVRQAWHHAAGPLIIALPAAAEAVQAARTLALDDQPGLTRVVCAVAGRTLLSDLTDDDCFHDDRGVAEVLTSQIEYADVIHATEAPASSAWAMTRLLAHPGAALTQRWDELPTALASCHRDHARVERWFDPTLRELDVTDCPHEDAWRLTVTTARAIDPHRFVREMDHLGTGPHRIRGCLWFASRPDDVCVIDGAAGNVSIGIAREWRPGEAFTRIDAVGLANSRSGAQTRRHLNAAIERCLTDVDQPWNGLHDGLEPWLGPLLTDDLN